LEAVMSIHVLSVGSCSADNYRLRRLVEGQLDADMSDADTAEEGLKRAADGCFDLILVNRIIDWDGTMGVDFITAARKANIATPIMLISDYTDAQAQAVANGATPGFGKSQLQDPEVVERLRDAVRASTAK
jgi:two-component system, chemotaxis family, chemotaxis protein CheY